MKTHHCGDQLIKIQIWSLTYMIKRHKIKIFLTMAGATEISQKFHCRKYLWFNHLPQRRWRYRLCKKVYPLPL